jgi:hypothetical protein
MVAAISFGPARNRAPCARVSIGVRNLAEIRKEVERASERRAELWEDLAEGHDAEKAAEAARLSTLIEDLWAEARRARARAQYGPSDEIITRARAEDRLDREARRWREAA